MTHAAETKTGLEASMIRHPARAGGLLATCCLTAMIWGSVPARAQYTTGSLGGTVTDPAGAVVPAATVKVQNEDTGLNKTVTTEADGTFLFPAMPVGRYKLTVVKTGFETYVQ